MSEYPESKEVGNVGEKEILRKILPKHPDAYIDDIGKANSKWDIFLPRANYGIEVKMDFKANYSKNILIEVEFDGKLSALSLTEAKYWVFITGYKYIWITPLQIYRFLEMNPAFGRTTVRGRGDNVDKTVHLPPLQNFLQYIYKLDKKDGWVDLVGEDEILYYKRFSLSGEAEDISDERILEVLNIKI